MGLEIEAKFLVERDADFTALRELNALGGFALRPAGVAEVQDTYLDTPERRLLAAGYACRLRESAGGLVVGLKSLVSLGGDVHVRTEVEVRIADAAVAVRPALWPAGEARVLTLAVAGDATLAPLCRIRQERAKSEVSRGGRTLFEMSADRAELPSLYRGLEVEILPGGTEQELAEFTALLCRRFRLEPDRLSKLERALTEAGIPVPGRVTPPPGARPGRDTEGDNE